jgi:hypothetical protein
MKQVYLVLFAALLSLTAIGQEGNTKPDCSNLKRGLFRYLDASDTTAWFIMEGEHHTEYFEKGKYFIKSKVKWTKDCQYKLEMVSLSLPNFPYEPGNVLTITIDKIEDDIIFYTASVKQDVWKGRMRKVQ